MRYLFSVLLILTLSVLPRPMFAAQPVILVLGDSLSAGHGIDRQRGWVQLLQDRLQQSGYAYKVVNASVSGDTTESGLSRLPYALKQHKPAIVIIELGGNDGLRGLSLSQLQTNLSQLVTLSKHAGAKVILCRERIPPNLGPAYTTKFSESYEAVATKQRIPFVPYFLKGVSDDPALMQDDGIHPNEKGQPGMLENVWPVLLPLLTKK
jgi:acyl-CoA thioesterase-1